jgi:putative phosphonate catabolism associated alcohol dehydrogenase
MPQHTRAAIFHQPNRPLELVDLPLPESVPPGGALCRVLLSTICGSDLHTMAGRRREPAPLILGHEIVGEIVALGDGLTTDGFGQPLAVGDRVSWTIAASCGTCRNCGRGLPQKCAALRKYGHNGLRDGHALSGGYAGHVQLWPGTTAFRVPETIPTPAAAPANCALATAVHAFEKATPQAGESVLILGAGLFGLSLAALAKEKGMGPILVADVRESRLAKAKAFGATGTLDLARTPPEEALDQLLDCTDGQGPRVVFEVCGQPKTAAWAVETMDLGGRLVVAGMVMPGTAFAVEGNRLARRCLSIHGIHNYAPCHLGTALRFLARGDHAALFAGAVGETFPLVAIGDAVAAARRGHALRIGVAPECG